MHFDLMLGSLTGDDYSSIGFLFIFRRSEFLSTGSIGLKSLAEREKQTSLRLTLKEDSSLYMYEAKTKKDEKVREERIFLGICCWLYGSFLSLSILILQVHRFKYGKVMPYRTVKSRSGVMKMLCRRSRRTQGVSCQSFCYGMRILR